VRFTKNDSDIAQSLEKMQGAGQGTKVTLKTKGRRSQRESKKIPRENRSYINKKGYHKDRERRSLGKEERGK